MARLALCSANIPGAQGYQALSRAIQEGVDLFREFRVGATPTLVLFREGQLVHRGDILATIDRRPFEAQLKEAEGQLVRDEALLFYCGLLSAHTRSATALRQLLMDYFEVPVEVEQFVGGWHPLDEDTQCRFTDSGGYSEQLGVGAVVGDEVWDQQSGVRIRLGPLTLSQYLDFLPNGTAHGPLRALVRLFCGSEIAFEVQLVLRKEEAPSCELGGEGAAARFVLAFRFRRDGWRADRCAVLQARAKGLGIFDGARSAIAKNVERRDRVIF